MISPELAKRIVSKVREKASPSRIVIFGSQARQDARRGSDIDVALFGVSRAVAELLRDELNEDLETLRDVDVVAFDDLENQDLRRRILSEGKTIYERDAGR